MTSAFVKPVVHKMGGERRNSPPPVPDSETEDEEVRMNCVAGVGRDLEDESDMNTGNRSNDDGCSSDFEDELEREPTQGVVTFINVPARTKVDLVRPKASPPPGQRLSPQKHGDSDSCSEDVEVVQQTIEKKELSCNDSNCSREQDDESQASMHSENEYNADSSDYSDEGEPFDEDEDDGDRHDFELSDILYSLGDVLECEVDESEFSGPAVRFIGVMEDRLDPINIPKAKRVLSYNTLAALNAEAGRKEYSPKRQRNEESCSSSPLPPFSLGPAAIPIHLGGHREGSPLISSSDDEDLDRQLEEELGDCWECRQAESPHEEEKAPIPLLTPPTSPLTVEVDGCSATICEWPSNLTVDSAMQAANELRPLSPASLEMLERDEQDRVGSRFGDDIGRGTFLTPLLQGVSIS